MHTILQVSGPNLCKLLHFPCDLPHYCCVIGKFVNDVVWASVTAARCVEGVEQCAQYTALERADAESAKEERSGSRFTRWGRLTKKVAGATHLLLDRGCTNQSFSHLLIMWTKLYSENMGLLWYLKVVVLTCTDCITGLINSSSTVTLKSIILQKKRTQCCCRKSET